MNTANEHMERLQAALGNASERAARLHRLLRSPFDEVGHPTLLALPQARHMLQADMDAAADAAELLGVELGDIRWTAVVGLLQNAATHVREANAWEASQVSGLLERLRVRVVQLRNAGRGVEPAVRLS